MISAFILSSLAFATPRPHASAHREPGHSYLEYMSLARPKVSDAAKVQDVAKPFAQFVVPALPIWPTGAETQRRFEALRDMRWLDDQTHRNFPRRVAWLFPDDGCFVRASLMSMVSKNNHWPEPAKVFIFGNLNLATPFAPQGLSEVSWWYHVAEIVEVGDVNLVIDPSVENQKPLPLIDWIKRVNFTPAQVLIAICSPGAYIPDDTCLVRDGSVASTAVSDEVEFLGNEWLRLEQLNRQPLQDLGEHPPWSIKSM